MSMRSILQAVIAITILYSPLSAQNWKFGPVPLEAAQAIARLSSFETAQEIQKGYGAAPLPLREGADTILVQGRFGSSWCGAQNCQAYILERRSNIYAVVLNAHSIQQLHILNSISNGYHDIETSMHGSATASDLVIYRYEGKKYQRTDCFSKEYLIVGNDQHGLPVYSKPVITRTCGK